MRVIETREVLLIAPMIHSAVINGVTIDFQLRVVEFEGELQRIEPKYAQFLELLLENKGVVVSREDIVDQVWDGAAGADQSITNAVSRLRKLLRYDKASAPVIETIPKSGYVLSADFVEAVTTADEAGAK